MIAWTIEHQLPSSSRCWVLG